MFNLKIEHNNTYNEIGQPNPLRWRVMLRKNNTMHSQSGLIKCKDFFNDIVAFKQAKMEFSIYHFSNAVKFNREGLYLHLTELYDVDQFCDNMDIVNDKLYEQLKVEVGIWPRADGSAIVLIPNKLWKNTYYISLVSMLIRLCNYKVDYTSWDSIFKHDAPINMIENAFTPKAKARVKQQGFVLPRGYRTYWFWAGKNCHSKDGKKVMPSVVHNNGVSSWNQWLEAK